jgi:hypothetical protein
MSIGGSLLPSSEVVPGLTPATAFSKRKGRANDANIVEALTSLQNQTHASVGFRPQSSSRRLFVPWRRDEQKKKKWDQR